MFRQAVRDSRLFSLPPATVATRLGSPNVPKSQVLYAPSASAARKNWGLKFPVSDARTRMVEFSQFEDRLRTNGTNAFPRFARKVRNLETLAAPLRLPAGRLGGMFVPGAQKRAQPLSSLRPRALRQLISEARSGNADPARAALLAAGTADATPQEESSALGATYAPSATFLNTPRGVLARKAAPGRVLGKIVQRGAVAFGGFVASDAHMFGYAAPAAEGARVPWQRTSEYIATLGGTRRGEVSVVVQQAAAAAPTAGSLLDRAANV